MRSKIKEACLELLDLCEPELKPHKIMPAQAAHQEWWSRFADLFGCASAEDSQLESTQVSLVPALKIKRDSVKSLKI